MELARRSFPAEVVDLQEMWGDYLMTQKQVSSLYTKYLRTYFIIFARFFRWISICYYYCCCSGMHIHVIC